MSETDILSLISTIISGIEKAIGYHTSQEKKKASENNKKKLVQK